MIQQNISIYKKKQYKKNLGDRYNHDIHLLICKTVLLISHDISMFKNIFKNKPVNDCHFNTKCQLLKRGNSKRQCKIWL